MKKSTLAIYGLVFIFLAISCYAECEDFILEYHDCYVKNCGTGYAKKEGCAASCEEIMKNNGCEYDKVADVCQKNECQVIVTSDFDGVLADGVSNITFTLAVLGDYEKFGFEIKPRAGETLKGKTRKISDKKIIFTPDKADKNKDYLEPQAADAVGWCMPEKASCETEAPQKKEVKKNFTIEQPPIFFVHGIWSDSGVWEKFEQRVKGAGWQYEHITYPSQDNVKNAGQLSYEIKEFIKKIRTGSYYDRKRISASKIDIVSHSMGGVVTRYYIGSGMYEGNIRKFIMMGTPNQGAWDPKALSYPYWGGYEEALDQLTPGSDFLKGLNNKSLNKDIDYYAIAGTGWSTHVGFEKLSTWKGDGVVPVDSVRVKDVPIFCTYDTHAAKISWIKGGIVKKKGFDTSKGIIITTSEPAYEIAKSLLLKGNATNIANCDEEYMPDPSALLRKRMEKQQIAHLKSPATLHAYDKLGNHIGLDRKGKVENTIGEDAYYISNSSGIEGQVINVIGDKEIKFVIKGYGVGNIGLEFTSVAEDGSVTENSFENVSIDARTQYVFDASSKKPALVKEELEAEKTGFNWYMPAMAIFAIVFGIFIIINSKKNKPKANSKKGSKSN
ncbi:MAG: hypothetical protein Q8O89_00060 [Nanoarchaeota archaeon]|nr:hypothetical protein [Nanoarchaeota archaeon]